MYSIERVYPSRLLFNLLKRKGMCVCQLAESVLILFHTNSRLMAHKMMNIQSSLKKKKSEEGLITNCLMFLWQQCDEFLSSRISLEGKILKKNYEEEQ